MPPSRKRRERRGGWERLEEDVMAEKEREREMELRSDRSIDINDTIEDTHTAV